MKLLFSNASDFNRFYSALLIESETDDSISFMQGPITLKTMPKDSFRTTDSQDDQIRFRRDELQDMFQSLWDKGFRPGEHVSQDHIAALERHLKDEREMRTAAMELVFEAAHGRIKDGI